MVSNVCPEKLPGPGTSHQSWLSYGQTVQHETLRLPLRDGQIRVEKVEETIPRVGSSIPIHVRDVLVQREKERAIRDDATRRLHGRLYRTSFGQSNGRYGFR